MESEIRQSVIDELINTPQTENFTEAMKSEIAHHLERWGDESIRSPHDFALVIGYLQGKLTKSIWDKNREKYEHHLITLAAVCGTSHRYLNNEESNSFKWFQL